MISGVRVYIEGHHRLRTGFQDFLKSIREKVRARGLEWAVVMGEGQVVRDFMKALRAHPTALNVLLKDSEGPDDGRLFASLRQRNDWSPPAGMNVDEDQVFWMVQVMEAWFLADRDALKRFYGNDFNENSLPGNPNVEEVPNRDVFNGLKLATSKTRTGQYNKTAHAPRLLSLLSMPKVSGAASNCRRLSETLIQKLTA